MREIVATVRNGLGIHCRPAAVIVKRARDYAGEIRVLAASGACDPRSALALLALGLKPGQDVRVRVSGPDEDTVCSELAELFEYQFDFAPQ